MIFRHYKHPNQNSSVQFHMFSNLTTSLDTMPTSMTTLLEHSAVLHSEQNLGTADLVVKPYITHKSLLQ